VSANAKPRGRTFVRSEVDLDIVEAMDHPGLFQQWFAGESWNGWRSILKATFALPMSESEVAFFKTVAERDPPRGRVRELWVVAGRRAGKDSIASLIATYAALFFQAGLDKLRPGERALVQCLACDREQAKIVLGYVRSYFDFIPPLDGMVRRRRVDGLALCNDVDIVISTNSYRAVRGRSVLVSIFDEVAFWQDERSSRPDVETYNAVKPSLATLPNSMIVAISSGYKKSGLLWTKYKAHYGQSDDDILVVKAPSLTLNPTLDQTIIDKALEDDPAAARSEWLGEFRDDVSSFIDPEVVEACVVRGRRELPRVGGVSYFGFVDPSGGSSDSMTLAIAHRENERVVLDCLRERKPPFSPDEVTREFSETLKSYGVVTTIGDKYGGLWPAERFQHYGIRYEPCAKPKSDLYRDLLPSLNANRVELLDNPRLVNQLAGLERRTVRGGRDSIDHQPNAHDDLGNALAGVVDLALGSGAGLASITDAQWQTILRDIDKAGPYRAPEFREGQIFPAGQIFH
jgi:hypothetical protein